MSRPMPTVRIAKSHGEPPATVELVLLLLCAAGVAMGFADADRAPLHAFRAVGLVVVPAVVGLRSLLRPSLSARRGTRAPLWLPALTIGAAVAIQATGGLTGVATPAAFLAVGGGSLVAGHRRALPWAAVAIVAVLLPVWLGLAAVTPIASQIGFVLALLACAIVPGHALTAERGAHDRTRSQLRTLEDEAGGLRHETGQALPHMRGSSYSAQELDRDVRAIARELQEDMERACSVLVAATGVATASVYRPGDERSGGLISVAAAGETSDLVPSVDVREGIFGAAFKAGTPVCLKGSLERDPRLAHRIDATNVVAVLAIPMVDGERPFGVVVLDATDEATLDERARRVAGSIADFMARLVARAVDLTVVRGGMREKDAFYEACREVSRHVRIDAITGAVVRSAGEFVPMDACALALCDDAGEQMRVVGSTGFDPAPPEAPFFITPSEGLLAHSVRHRTAIKRNDAANSGRAPVLFGSANGPTADLASLLVLPIVAPGSANLGPLGALVVARRSGADFDREDAERLQVLLHQVGAAISNGRLFAEHETRGVTDSMTGLPNHRHFQDVLATKLASSQRTRLKTSLLLLDIDKFKLVNDTYGHPMGDEVIKRLASLMSEFGREGTDLAARYGGEEFCLVLEDTDAEGAKVVADRIREAFKREAFVYREGNRPVSFRCSVSIGIASFPKDAANKQELIDRADQALYSSKERGRDRATCWQDLRSSQPGAKSPRARTGPGAQQP